MIFKRNYFWLGLLFLNILILTIGVVLDIIFFETFIIFLIFGALLIAINLFYIYLNFQKTKIGNKIDNKKNNNFIENNIALNEILTVKDQGYLKLDENKFIFEISEMLLNYGFEYFYKKELSYFQDLEQITTKNQIFDGKYWNFRYLKSKNIIFVTDKTNEYLLEKANNSFDIVLKFKISRETTYKFDNFIVNTITNDVFQLLSEFFKSQNGYFNENLSSLNGTGFLRTESIHNFKSLFMNTISEIEKIFETKDIKISFYSGIGLGYRDFKQINNLAIEALQHSELRGINQISLKEPNKPIEYLSKSSISNPSSVTRILEFINEMYNKAIQADYIYITTHKNADLDAFGAAISMHYLLNQLNLNSKIVLDTMDNTTKLFYKQGYNSYENAFINNLQPNNITTKSILIIVDTSNPDLLQQKSIETLFSEKNIFIIDHHEENLIQIPINIDNKLINNSASSASELLVRIISCFPESIQSIKLPKEIANALLAGIYLDTRILLSNTTKFTFEAIAYLSEFNISISDISKYIKSTSEHNLDTFINLIDNIQVLDNKIISFVDPNIILTSEEISVLANELLDFKNIEASFVIAKIENNKFKVSCRSNGQYNVQILSEKLGGGGKINASAIEFDLSVDSRYTVEYIKDAIIQNL